MMRKMILLTLATTACACNTQQGSGVIKTEQRQVAAFNEVEIHGAFQVEMNIGGTPELTVVADDKVLPFIKSEVRGKRLILSMKKNNFTIMHKLLVRLRAPDLTLLEVSGVARFSAKGINNDALRLDLSGASHTSLAGKTTKFELKISGAGAVLAKELQSRQAKVICSGAAKVEVFASDSVDLNISGAGRISYWGSPKAVNQKVSGVGKIVKR